MAWWDDAAEALGSVVGFFAGNDGNDALWFAITTPRNGRPVQDGTPLCIAIFGFVDGKHGLTSGRIIKRGSGCGARRPSEL